MDTAFGLWLFVLTVVSVLALAALQSVLQRRRALDRDGGVAVDGTHRDKSDDRDGDADGGDGGDGGD